MILLIQNDICMITETNNMIILPEGFLRKTIIYFEIRNMIFFSFSAYSQKMYSFLKNIWFKILRVVGKVTNQFLLTLVENNTLHAQKILQPVSNCCARHFLQNIYVLGPPVEYWNHSLGCKHYLPVSWEWFQTFVIGNPLNWALFTFLSPFNELGCYATLIFWIISVSYTHLTLPTSVTV